MKQLFFMLIAMVGFTFAVNAQVKGGQTKGGSQPKTEFSGTFDSKKGVMHHISCYSHNVGYLTTAPGDKIIVSFDKLPNASDLEINCEYITVSGYYELKSIDGGGGPCSAGSEYIFYATEWRCD